MLGGKEGEDALRTQGFADESSSELEHIGTRVVMDCSQEPRQCAQHLLPLEHMATHHNISQHLRSDEGLGQPRTLCNHNRRVHRWMQIGQAGIRNIPHLSNYAHLYLWQPGKPTMPPQRLPCDAGIVCLVAHDVR